MRLLILFYLERWTNPALELGNGWTVTTTCNKGMWFHIISNDMDDLSHANENTINMVHLSMPESQLNPVNKRGPWPLSSYSWYTTQRFWQHSLLFIQICLAYWIWSIPVCIASRPAQSNIDIAQSWNGYRWGDYTALLIIGLKTMANNKIHESKIMNTSVDPMCCFGVMVITFATWYNYGQGKNY